MDLLKQELAKKRKALATDFAGKKLLKRSEIDQKTIQNRNLSLSKPTPPSSSSSSSTPTAASSAPTATPTSTPSLPPALAPKPPPPAPLSDDQKINSLVLPRAETIRRLRILKQPATLFGEDDDARLDRLKHHLTHGTLEIDDEMTQGQTNDFLRDIYELKKRQKTSSFHQEKSKHKDGDAAAEEAGDGEEAADGEEASDGEGDGKRMKAEFKDLCIEDKILVFFKRLLNEWHQELEGMPDSEKRTAKGKALVATYKQCARYLTPLFKFCRKKMLADDIRRGLLVVVNCCMKRDYLAAMDQYIKLAIGNAPWPIGVTMVGIHERSAREKIYTNSVAHIMNDETTRKYLQSVKRLMTFCQRLYPAMPSKSVEFNSLANGSDLRSLLAEEEEKGSSEGRLRLMPAPRD